jgi:membrane protein
MLKWSTGLNDTTENEFLTRSKRLSRHVWQHFLNDRCFEEAASLGYTSLLSLVPLLAVVFGVATAFPVFDRWSVELQSFIFENFVPAAGEQVEAYLSGFLESVNRLTLPGTFLLIISALLLMMRIEAAFNRIWRVAVQRRLVNRVVMYWAVLTLGPMALGVAAALSAQPLFNLLDGEVVSSHNFHAIWIFILTWLTFGMVFLLVPNRSVRVKHAALGALLSACLFTLAKTGFVWFVGRASYNVIYGTLATIPIFLLWLYLAWLVTLLGASLAAALTTFMDRGGDWRWPWEWELLLAVRLIGHLRSAHRSGQTLSESELMRLEPGMSGRMLQGMLEHFMDCGIVTQNPAARWLLARDLEAYTLLDLYHSGKYHLPLGRSLEVPNPSVWDGAFLNTLTGDQGRLNTSLASIYSESDAR